MVLYSRMRNVYSFICDVDIYHQGDGPMTTNNEWEEFDRQFLEGKRIDSSSVSIETKDGDELLTIDMGDVQFHKGVRSYIQLLEEIKQFILSREATVRKEERSKVYREIEDDMRVRALYEERLSGGTQ